MITNPNNTDSKCGKHLISHVNDYPDEQTNRRTDEGQTFYPFDNKPIIIFANTVDDLIPEDWIVFRCDGNLELCIGADIWHETIQPLPALACLYNKQGAVHARARVSGNFPKAFVSRFSSLLIRAKQVNERDLNY